MKNPAMDDYSPTKLGRTAQCALKALAVKDLVGEALDVGEVRHKALELYYLDDSLSLHDAALAAASQFPNYPESTRMKAIEAIRAIDSRHLPDRMLAVSIEGSDLPEELTIMLYGNRNLRFVGRAEEGPWGRPYALRMRADLILKDGPVLLVKDWKGADPSFGGTNDVLAMCQFLGAVHIARALEWTDVTHVHFDAVGIPSLIRDHYEFKVDQYETILQVVDKLVWYRRGQEALWNDSGHKDLEARPGGHCKGCPLASGQCPKYSEAVAFKPPVDPVANLEDLELVDLHEQVSGYLDLLTAVEEATKKELLGRLKQRVEKKQPGILSEGYEYTAKEQNSSGMKWDFDAAVSFFRERLKVPQDQLKRFLKIGVSKKALEQEIRGRANDVALRKTLVDESKKLYTQSTYWKIQKKPIKDEGALVVEKASDDGEEAPSEEASEEG